MKLIELVERSAAALDAADSIEKTSAARAWFVDGGVLDEPATARALATVVLRGLDCGALDVAEVEAATVAFLQPNPVEGSPVDALVDPAVTVPGSRPVTNTTMAFSARNMA